MPFTCANAIASPAPSVCPIETDFQDRLGRSNTQKFAELPSPTHERGSQPQHRRMPYKQVRHRFDWSYGASSPAISGLPSYPRVGE